MKKLSFIAVACSTLAACNLIGINPDKPEEIQTAETAFVAGQKVTLSVGAAINGESDTKVNSILNGTNIDFKWEDGDKLLVKVGSGDDEKTAEFTLVKGSGSNTGYFEGVMPAGGDTFDAQYPVTPPELFKQDLGEEPVSHDMMLFYKTGCTLDAPIKLEPQYAVLRLNLWGDTTIGKIVVSDRSHMGSSPDPLTKYELNCKPGSSDGLSTGSYDSPSPVHILIYPDAFKFIVDVYDAESSPSIICSFEKQKEVTFAAGKTINFPKPPKYGDLNIMPTKVNTFWWAPVNCGYDNVHHPSGQLYQFGRQDGCGLESETANQQTNIPNDEEQITSIVKNPSADRFYLKSTGTDDWYARNIGDTQLTTWPMTAENKPEGTTRIYNPCPDGWYVPDITAFTYFFDAEDKLKGKYNGDKEGWDFGNGLIFPAAGWRSGIDGEYYSEEWSGLYWTCTERIEESYTHFYSLTFSKNIETPGRITSESRACALSVRCVQFVQETQPYYPPMGD